MRGKVHGSEADSVHAQFLEDFYVAVDEGLLVVEVVGDGEVGGHLDNHAAAVEQQFAVLVVDEPHVLDPESAESQGQEQGHHYQAIGLHR